MAKIKGYFLTKEFMNKIFGIFIMILGSTIIAFGVAIFLSKLEIVSGGVGGIAIIIQHFIPEGQYIDIITAILNVLLFLLGLIFLGKDFAIKTLVATIVYPLALTLFLRVEYFQHLSEVVAGDGSVGYIIICGVFGGVFMGTGVAITFLGGGSTGGVDIIVILIAEKTHAKESILSFVVDAIIILASIIFIRENLVNSLCGVISAFLSALMIEFLFVNQTASIQADIISDKWEDISKFAQDKLMRGATIIKAKGGYKGDERIILRVVFDRRQFEQFKKYIAEADPKAFITYTQTNAVYGEGFYSHKTNVKNKK